MNPVKLFQKEFKNFLTVKHAKAVSNGTAALHSSLLATGVEWGDKVITTPFTFIATTNSILMCGATPIFADIKPETCCLDPLEVEKQLRNHPNVKAILAVHLFGNMTNILELKEIAENHEIMLIEDSSQALGATLGGRMAGTFGDAGTFSFYASKNLWTFEGGMVVTNNDTIAENIDEIRNHGLDKTGKMRRMGYNYKMPWNCAFQGWQMLKLHKPAILAELGRYGLKDGYYPLVVYQHPYYIEQGIKGNCPVAEKMALFVRGMLNENL